MAVSFFIVFFIISVHISWGLLDLGFKSPRNEDSFNIFLNWLKEQDVDLSYFEVRRTSDGEVGLFCSKNISTNEIISIIPRHLAITSLPDIDPRVSDVMLKVYNETSDGHIVVQLQLIWQAFYANESKWTPYINILPRTFSHLPVTWENGSEEMSLVEQFQSSNLLLTIRRGKFLTQEVVKYLLGVMSQFPNLFGEYTEEKLEKWSSEIKWAKMVVDTRAFGRRGENDTADCALIPFFDLINHKSGHSAPLGVFNATTADLLAYAIVFNEESKFEIPDVGQEFFQSYTGDEIYCNSRLLLGYGFVENRNQNNCIRIDTSYRKNNDQSIVGSLRYTFLLKYGFSEESSHILAGGQTINPSLLSTLRLSFLDVQEIENLPDMISSGDDVPFLSLSNERSALRSILTLAISEVNKYNEVLPPDEEIDASIREKLFSKNIENILQVLKGERQTYMTLIDTVNAAWSSLLYS